MPHLLLRGGGGAGLRRPRRESAAPAGRRRSSEVVRFDWMTPPVSPPLPELRIRRSPHRCQPSCRRRRHPHPRHRQHRSRREGRNRRGSRPHPRPRSRRDPRIGHRRRSLRRNPCLTGSSSSHLHPPSLRQVCPGSCQPDPLLRLRHHPRLGNRLNRRRWRRLMSNLAGRTDKSPKCPAPRHCHRHHQYRRMWYRHSGSREVRRCSTGPNHNLSRVCPRLHQHRHRHPRRHPYNHLHRSPWLYPRSSQWPQCHNHPNRPTHHLHHHHSHTHHQSNLNRNQLVKDYGH